MLTRGDSAYLQVPIKNKLPDGSTEDWQLSPGDRLTMTVAKNYESDPLFQKTVEDDNTFHILPSDTMGCEFGNYKYDVQLTTAAGDVFTVIGPATFQVLPEVTRS